MISQSDRFAPNGASLTSAARDSEALLVDTTGTSYRFVGVTPAIWSMIGHGRSFGEMTQLLTAQYIVTADIAQRDLRRVLNSLLECGLISASVRGDQCPLTATVKPRLPYSPPGIQRNSEARRPEMTKGSENRHVYVSPVLYVYGKLEELTEYLNPGSADGFGGSHF